MIDRPKFSLKLLEENFVSLEIKEGCIIDVEEIHEINRGYKKLCQDNEYVVIIYGNNFSSFTSEARKVSAKKYFSKKRRKVALVSNNLAHIMVIKFYINFNKPKTNINIFSDRNKAIRWLKE
jgi:hypothetical protein